jgi:hypothetical protein
MMPVCDVKSEEYADDVESGLVLPGGVVDALPLVQQVLLEALLNQISILFLRKRV